MTAINANPQVVVPPVVVPTPVTLTLTPTNDLLSQMLQRLEDLIAITAWSAPNRAQVDVSMGTAKDSMVTSNDATTLPAEGL